MSTPDPSVTTIAQLLRLPKDGLRHELLRGEHVVTAIMSPEHQAASQEFFARFWAFSRDHPGVMVFYSPADIQLGPVTLVQPDIFAAVVDPENPPKDFFEMGVPALTLEIMSPETAGRDRGRKREIYQAAGVPEYWIVDLAGQSVERWRTAAREPEVLRDEITWRPLDGGPEMIVNLVEIFARLPQP